MERGVFIVIEGIDGCGKTTQVKLLGERLEKEGYPVVQIRDPGTTVIGEHIRNFLLDIEVPDIAPETEMLLFLAARAQMFREKIIPALEENKVVISERYSLSTICYQGSISEDLDPPIIRNIIKAIPLFKTPDITFLIDLPPEEALSRLNDQKDRIESRGVEFQRRVRKAFLKEAQIGERIKVIDGTLTAEEISEKIYAGVRNVLV